MILKLSFINKNIFTFLFEYLILNSLSVFRQHPHVPVYELKANEDLNRHGMYVLGAIKKIVNKIDDTEYLEKLFDDLSDKHRRIGVEASGMDVFGKVFCKVMRPILLGINFCLFLNPISRRILS